MLDMPRPRPLYLVRQVSRHGTEAWYVRRTVDGKRIAVRLRATYGTPEFEAEYHTAVAGVLPKATKPARALTGSLKWLWCRYTETGEWLSLKESTRRQRENIMSHVITKSGDVPAGDIASSDIIAGREARKSTPSQAKGFLVCMRAMYRWAVAVQHVKEDPTIGIKAFPRKKTKGFQIWAEEEVDRYQAHWPIGTKERVWIDVLLYTGLRRGDAVTIGRQHVRVYNVDGVAHRVASLRTEKGQGAIIVTLPILPVLQTTLDAGPCAELAFICGAAGKPLTKASFGNNFREACDLAGVFGKSAHGLRKVGATRAADNGATEKELDAIFGWVDGVTSAVYTREANRKRASVRAMALLERTEDSFPWEQGTPDEQPIATPKQLVWQSGNKS